MKCRFCWKAQINGENGSLQCEATGEDKTFEEANIQRECEHYELCKCGDPDHVDFYAEELYEPERDELQPVSKDQMSLKL